MSEEIKATIHRHIRRNVPRADGRRITPELDLRSDLGAYDLDLLQLVMDCEDQYPGRVYIDDDEFERIKTVGDLEAMMLAKLGQPDDADLQSSVSSPIR